jgi:phage head maturation protease
MLKFPTRSLSAQNLEVRADALPQGVCGVVTGIALRYNVVDAWGTVFLPGCLDKTRAKVSSGKVKLFDNHGARDGYGTGTHIGVVRSLVGAGDAEVMTAHLFDTEEGRRAKEYLSAVMASGGETGLSIGFYERNGDPVRDAQGNWQHYAFSEIELDEISLAPRNAVPGAEVTGVRREPDTTALRVVVQNLRRCYGDETLLALVRESSTDATAGDEPGGETAPAAPAEDSSRDEPTDERHAPADMATRLAAVRSTFTLSP